MRPAVLAFDVNETLLDLAALDDAFADVLGDPGLRAAWFQTMLQLAFVGAITGAYVDFTTAQHAALRMVAERAGRTVSDADAERIVGGMQRLPAHPDVPGALRALHDGGLRMVALTNSPLAVARAQLAFAGLDSLLDDVLSADEVRQLKPGPRPYALVAERTGVPLGEVMLVAAHGWDVSGALAAGARAAFIARPGMVPSPLGPQPELVAADLTVLVEELIA